MRVPIATSPVASSTAPIAISTGQGWVVRPAQRSDLWAAAELMHDSFAGEPKGGVDRWLTTCRLALDLEQRMTPWAWSRHLQLVAEEADSSLGDGLIGFAELWAEDDQCVEDTEASVPQPALFNVCVAEAAQGRGIGRELMSVSESQCRSWGERFLFLKVREGNTRALELYRRSSYEIFDSRVPLDVPAWQEQWKGGTPGTPLTRMRKRIDLPLERLLERLMCLLRSGESSDCSSTGVDFGDDEDEDDSESESESDSEDDEDIGRSGSASKGGKGGRAAQSATSRRLARAAARSAASAAGPRPSALSPRPPWPWPRHAPRAACAACGR